ncbi:error-prone DNA polymerase [Nevskia soli]|uniref:error-prone DNA polymerase n=1 Tax=Nevskia soli TaxID=418856 RepID=UPI0015D8F28F|nr:error-prone DNA polymerase [Nevskia soli]
MYIELHARSAFSFLQGASLPEEYAAIAAHFGYPALALVDRDGFYGSPRFHLAAKKAGVRAHIGAEILGADGARYPLLVKSRAGYQNLCRLITRAKMRVPKNEPAIATPEDFTEFADGLICLTGDERGPLALALPSKSGSKCLDQLTGIFGKKNVYVEVQRHFDREQEWRNEATVELARRMRIPLVATGGVCHARPEQRSILDLFTCLHHKTTLAQAGRLLSKNSQRHLRPPEEMAQLFADLPDAIANTNGVSARLNFTLSDLGYQFPEYPVPRGETQMSFLRKRTDEGARRRYRPYHDKARNQIERELALIEKLQLAGYFLIVWDVVNFCRDEGILVQGRGSAANSAVCYSLGITAVDPVGMELLFERFLSEERGEWPDIDLDLPSGEKRERVIQHVYERYGKFGAAMTANVITYRGRSAAREAGKVLGFEVETLDRLSSLVPIWGFKDKDNTAEKQFSDAGLDLNHPKIRTFLNLVTGLQDLPRHLGQHSGGMVVCQGRLDTVVPLEPATMPDRVVVQWDKEDCADLGIVKVDLLGLGMMAVLEDCLMLIRDHWGEEIDLGCLPPDDPQVFGALQKADTIGWFQVESRAQQASLPRMKPVKFYDLVVQVAIIRPGPIVGKMVHPYLARRQGREKVVPLHPLLEPVLARTLGVPLFQEQLLRMAMVVAGFTGGEAEDLRRAMGFKRSEQRMKDIEVKLRTGMARNGINEATQDLIVQSITSFALYGFPESHAASFALLAYASGYFKVHYLAAFSAAILNNQPMGFYHPAVLIKDAQRHGLRVLPVDITISDWNCTVEEDGAKKHLRLGLRYARGLREATSQAILKARAERPFETVDDLAGRVPELHTDEMNRLAEIGALNPLDPKHRRDALWKAGRASRPTGPLLISVPETAPESPLVQMTTEERVTADYRGTTVTIGRHPMAYRREEMNALGVTPARDLARVRPGGLVRIAGNVIVRQRPGTAAGIVFLSVEDETGIANAVVMPDLFAEQRLLLVTEPWLMVEGKLQNVDNVIHVLARKVTRLPHKTDASPAHNFH